ncbi:TPA: hypothetical protein EYP38_03925 [Candidatus Micrarchaeota archaeon]|nr:hypothetical protein [Candidatus Micrarchaeota archaeon]
MITIRKNRVAEQAPSRNEAKIVLYVGAVPQEVKHHRDGDYDEDILIPYVEVEAEVAGYPHKHEQEQCGYDCECGHVSLVQVVEHALFLFIGFGHTISFRYLIIGPTNARQAQATSAETKNSPVVKRKIQSRKAHSAGMRKEIAPISPYSMSGCLCR